MGAPKVPRIKAPRKKSKNPDANHFSRLSKTPAGRAQLALWRTTAWSKAGRPGGLPDGFTKETFEAARAAATAKAERIVQIMADEGFIEPDDELAKKAMKTASEIMELEAGTCPETQKKIRNSARDRLAAAKIILDFTKQKPVQKSENTINAAEDFLAALVAQDTANKE